MWFFVAMAVFSALMVIATIDEQEPQDWYENPLSKDEEGDEDDVHDL